MTVDFLHLLTLRDERREACPDARIDAIVTAKLKTRTLAALRSAIDELGQIECDREPALSARVDAKLAWIRAVIAAFAGPDA